MWIFCPGEGSRRFSEDLLSDCKYVFTDEEEAKEALAKVHSGIHSEDVKAHHNPLRSLPSFDNERFERLRFRLDSYILEEEDYE